MSILSRTRHGLVYDLTRCLLPGLGCDTGLVVWVPSDNFPRSGQNSQTKNVMDANTRKKEFRNSEAFSVNYMPF